MAKETAKKKKVAAKSSPKPKTMAARRTTSPSPVTARRTRTVTPNGPTVRKSIVSAILSTRKKTFTSTDIAEASNASHRHSRRTLSVLADQRILIVERTQAPFQYRVVNRDRLREASYRAN